MAKKKKGDALFVKSKVREYIKSKDANASSELLDTDALNEALMDILDRAVRRAKANARKAIKATDL